MKVTLYRNNPHAPNGLMSQETLDCDEYRLMRYRDDEPINPRKLDGKLLLVNQADFAAILVDTTEDR